MTTQPLEDFDNEDLLPSERVQINELTDAANEADTEDKRAAVLLGAFVAYRLYATRVTTAKTLEDILRGEQLRTRAFATWVLFRPYFLLMVAPMFASALSREVKEDLPPSTIHLLAVDYANRVGEYFAATSSEAIEAGFNAMINRKVLSRVAAERAMFAFGLTKRQMNAYVAAAFDTNEKNTAAQISPRFMARRYIVKSLDQRLTTMADVEAYSMLQEAQHVTHLWGLRTGRLSEDAKRVWVTAADEKVCKICGPMNGQAVGIRERFELPDGGRVWVTGVHPRCRCRIKLVTRTLQDVAKADAIFMREHPQDVQTGRFVRKPKGRVLPGLEDLLTEPAELTAPKGLTAVPTRLSAPTGLQAPSTGLSAPAGLVAPAGLKATTKPETVLEKPTMRIANVEPIVLTGPLMAVDRKERALRSVKTRMQAEKDAGTAWMPVTGKHMGDFYGSLDEDSVEFEINPETGERERVRVWGYHDFKEASSPSAYRPTNRSTADQAQRKFKEVTKLLHEHLDGAFYPVIVEDGESDAQTYLWGQIDEHVIADVVSAAERSYNEDDEALENGIEWVDTEIEVELYDDDHQPTGKSMKVDAKELARFFQEVVSEDDDEDWSLQEALTLDVYHFDRTHWGATGGFSSEYGAEEMSMDGMYSMTDEGTGHVNGFRVRYWRLDPIEYYGDEDE